MKNVSVALIGARMRTPPWHSFLCISSAILVITVVLIFSTGCVTSAPAGVSSPARTTETISLRRLVTSTLSNTSSSSCRRTGRSMNTLVPIPGLTGYRCKTGTIRLRAGSGNQNLCEPYHDQNGSELGGPHGAAAARRISMAERWTGSSGRSRPASESHARIPFNPDCSAGSGQPDVMGYHDSREIPNYWNTPMSSFSRTGCSSPRLVEPAFPPFPSSRPGPRNAVQPTR